LREIKMDARGRGRGQRRRIQEEEERERERWGQEDHETKHTFTQKHFSVLRLMRKDAVHNIPKLVLTCSLSFFV
jgi:hypothetical protein